MRDNRNIEGLSDQAWAKMKVLLDQEMPVDKQRKRRPFFWLFLLVGLTLAGAGGYWYSTKANPQEAPQRIKKSTFEKPIAQQGDIAESADTRSTASSEHLSSKPAQNHSNKAIKLSKSTINTGPQTTAPKGPEASVNSNEIQHVATPASVPQIKPSSSLNTASEKIASTTEEVNNTEHLTPISTTRENTELTTIDHPERARYPLLQELPTLSMLPFDLPAQSLNLTNLYHPKESILLPLVLNLGIVSRQINGIDGVFAELKTGINLRKQGKWSLQSGIGLHYQKSPFVISRVTSVLEPQANLGTPTMDQGQDPSTPLSASDPALESNFVKAVASSGIYLKNLYVDIPLTLQWQAKPRWAIGLGSRFSWRLSSYWTNNTGGGNEDLALTNESNALYVFNASSRSLDQLVFSQSTNNSVTGSSNTLKLSNFNLAGTIGISFRPSAKWNLRLQYQHGVTNQLNDQDFKMKDRSLWFSIGKRL